MTEPLIKPDHIRRIDIQYFAEGNNLLYGLRLCDKDDNTLTQCGPWQAPSDYYITHTMLIEENERLVGVRSKTWKKGGLGAHYDIEFLVYKYK